MKIQTFIEKAISGGWKRPAIWEDSEVRNPSYGMLCQILLDPLAWQAVGKTEGWEDTEMCVCMGCGLNLGPKEITTYHKCKKCDSDTIIYEGRWHIEMHNLVDALAEGRSIEQFLETL